MVSVRTWVGSSELPVIHLSSKASSRPQHIASCLLSAEAMSKLSGRCSHRTSTSQIDPGSILSMRGKDRVPPESRLRLAVRISMRRLLSRDGPDVLPISTFARPLQEYVVIVAKYFGQRSISKSPGNDDGGDDSSIEIIPSVVHMVVHAGCAKHSPNMDGNEVDRHRTSRAPAALTRERSPSTCC
jgi:hypothetical protein